MRVPERWSRVVDVAMTRGDRLHRCHAVVTRARGCTTDAPVALKKIQLGKILKDADPDCLAEAAPKNALCFDLTRDRLLVGVEDTVHAFDLRDGTRVQEYDLAMRDLDPIATWCHLLCVTPDGRHLVAALSMGNGGESWSHLRVFDVASGQCVAEPDVPDHLMTVAVDPTGELLVCTDPWSVQVHRVGDGVRVARDEDLPASRVGWDPTTGDLIALEDNAMRILDPRTLATRERVAYARGMVPPMQSIGGLHVRALTSSPFVTGCPTWTFRDALRLWGDDPDEALLWLSPGGDLAYVLRDAALVRLRAGRPPEVAHRVKGVAPGTYVEAAVCDDGARFAVRQGPIVSWGRLDADASAVGSPRR